jgi:shikimate kinase
MSRDQESGKIRPSLTGLDPLEEIKQVLDIRSPLYQRYADFVVYTSFLSIREVADSIMKALPKGLRG